jgi:hypothetical protein
MEIMIMKVLSMVAQKIINYQQRKVSNRKVIKYVLVDGQWIIDRRTNEVLRNIVEEQIIYQRMNNDFSKNFPECVRGFWSKKPIFVDNINNNDTI